MAIMLKSSAPHVRGVARVDQELLEVDSTLKVAPIPVGPNDWPQLGIIRSEPSRWPMTLESCDQLCHFLEGRATCTREGETIEVEPGTVVHFKTGWKGEIQVHETVHFVYVCFPGAPAEKTPVLRDAATVPAEKDWGIIPTMLEGESRTSGILLSRDGDGGAESGIWICTPGKWHCHVTRDEFCHFLSGRCTYTHDATGEVIEIEPDTAAFFPKDWKDTCLVHETVRKVYFIA